jgi:hypothetical protein
MGDAQYFSEFECDPTSPIIGAYFGQEMKDCDVDGRLEPNLAIIDGPIHTAWDLGNQSNMAIWAFQVGDEDLRIIDFICDANWFFKDYVAELNRRGYTGNDYLPHDAAVKSFETGLTRLETPGQSRQEARARAPRQGRGPDTRRPAGLTQMPVRFHQMRTGTGRAARIPA